MIVELINSHRTKPIPSRRIRGLIQLIRRREKKVPLNGLSVIFIDAKGIRKINRRFLNHDYATDVLSFDLSDAAGIDGEVYINLDAAASQAKEFGVTYANEVLRLVAHGLLHLLGYDDGTVRKRRAMLKRGDRYLALLK